MDEQSENENMWRALVLLLTSSVCSKEAQASPYIFRRTSLYSLFAAWPNAPSTRSERCQCFFLCCVLLLLLLGPAHPAGNPARPDAKRPCRVSTVGHAVEWRAVDGA